MNCLGKTGLAAAVVAVAGLGLPPATASAGPASKVVRATSAGSVASPDGQCQTLTLPVSIYQNQAPDLAVAGTYCTPDNWQPGPPEVDVLTPGATYNQTYWNWPVDPALYSYVDKTLAVGGPPSTTTGLAPARAAIRSAPRSPSIPRPTCSIS